MRIRDALLIQAGMALLLCGCQTAEPPPEAVVEEADAMIHLGAELRPETLHFPEYLLMPDFELDQHGRIPGSSVVGVELKTKLDLATTLQRITEMLTSHEWRIAREEMESHAFRLLAAMKGESLEIRAVQGTGPTQVFMLYRP
jgi:hypothetical protein